MTQFAATSGLAVFFYHCSLSFRIDGIWSENKIMNSRIQCSFHRKTMKIVDFGIFGSMRTILASFKGIPVKNILFFFEIVTIRRDMFYLLLLRYQPI